MQVGVGSGYHIGKRILRIRKAALNRLRYENNTTKISPKTIVVSGVDVREPKGHVIPLAGHGRDGLIKKPVGATRSEVRLKVSTMWHNTIEEPCDSAKRGVSGVGPRWKATGFETTVNIKARVHCCRRRGRR